MPHQRNLHFETRINVWPSMIEERSINNHMNRPKIKKKRKPTHVLISVPPNCPKEGDQRLIDVTIRDEGLQFNRAVDMSWPEFDAVIMHPEVRAQMIAACPDAVKMFESPCRSTPMPSGSRWRPSSGTGSERGVGAPAASSWGSGQGRSDRWSGNWSARALLHDRFCTRPRHRWNASAEHSTGGHSPPRPSPPDRY
jgi:hypothetical protein